MSHVQGSVACLESPALSPKIAGPPYKFSRCKGMAHRKKISSLLVVFVSLLELPIHLKQLSLRFRLVH